MSTQQVLQRRIDAAQAKHKVNLVDALNDTHSHAMALFDAHDDDQQILIATASDEEISALNALYPNRFTNVQ